MNNKSVLDAAGKAAAMRDLCAEGIPAEAEASEIIVGPAATRRL
jgi:hypothetical protein